MLPTAKAEPPRPVLERRDDGRSQAGCSARSDTLGGPAPYLDRQSWDPSKFTDIGTDHGEPVGNTGGRQPEIMRPNQSARRSQGRPHLGMSAGRGQIHRQQGKTLQDGFDKGGPLRTDLQLHGAMYPVEQFTGRDD